MNDETTPAGESPETSPESPEPLVFDPDERRILGVLIEKGLTTPAQYPMSLSAIVAACNQKSNRDPITHYDEDLVEEVLERLQAQELLSHFYPGEGGRVHRWRQNLGLKYELRRAQLAIVGELFLRGAQSEGDLRQRASRMEPIDSLDALHELLRGLSTSRPRFVIRLTREGVSRGVRYTHACYEEGEMREVLAAEASGAATSAPPAASSSARGGSSGALDAVNERLAALEARIARLEAALGESPDGD